LAVLLGDQNKETLQYWA